MFKKEKVQFQFEQKIRIATEQENIHLRQHGFMKQCTKDLKIKYKKWCDKNEVQPTLMKYIEL